MSNEPNDDELIAALYEMPGGDFWRIDAPERKGYTMYGFPDRAAREVVKYLAEWVATKSTWKPAEFLNSIKLELEREEAARQRKSPA